MTTPESLTARSQEVISSQDLLGEKLPQYLDSLSQLRVNAFLNGFEEKDTGAFIVLPDTTTIHAEGPSIDTLVGVGDLSAVALANRLYAVTKSQEVVLEDCHWLADYDDSVSFTEPTEHRITLDAWNVYVAVYEPQEGEKRWVVSFSPRLTDADRKDVIDVAESSLQEYLSNKLLPIEDEVEQALATPMQSDLPTERTILDGLSIPAEISFDRILEKLGIDKYPTDVPTDVDDVDRVLSTRLTPSLSTLLFEEDEEGKTWITWVVGSEVIQAFIEESNLTDRLDKLFAARVTSGEPIENFDMESVYSTLLPVQSDISGIAREHQAIYDQALKKYLPSKVIQDARKLRKLIYFLNNPPTHPVTLRRYEIMDLMMPDTSLIQKYVDSNDVAQWIVGATIDKEGMIRYVIQRILLTEDDLGEVSNE